MCSFQWVINFFLVVKNSWKCAMKINFSDKFRESVENLIKIHWKFCEKSRNSQDWRNFRNAAFNFIPQRKWEMFVSLLEKKISRVFSCLCSGSLCRPIKDVLIFFIEFFTLNSINRLSWELWRKIEEIMFF